VQQWFEMTKAQNMEQWRAALEQNGVLSFNIVYADKQGNIGEIYNAKMPDRIEGPKWDKVLPGDQSKLIWTEYRAVSELPQLWNPDCGWVFSANATPFNITDAACNNQRSDFSQTYGLEKRITNRSRRALTLFQNDDAISEEELLRYRADTKYDPQSQIMQMVVELVTAQSDDPLIQEAQEVLRNWDGDTLLKCSRKRPQSLKSALAVLILSGVRLTVFSVAMSIYRSTAGLIFCGRFTPIEMGLPKTV